MKGYSEKIKSLKQKIKKTYREKTNLDVIEMFIEDSFPKDKRQTWGTPNLKITSYVDENGDKGWGLKNYDTFLLRRTNSGELHFNLKKYSVSTTKIQNQIKRILNDKGIKYTTDLEESISNSKKESNNEVIMKAKSKGGKHILTLEDDSFTTEDGKKITSYVIVNYERSMDNQRGNFDAGDNLEDAKTKFKEEVENWNEMNIKLGKLHIQ